LNAEVCLLSSAFFFAMSAWHQRNHGQAQRPTASHHIHRTHFYLVELRVAIVLKLVHLPLEALALRLGLLLLALRLSDNLLQLLYRLLDIGNLGNDLSEVNHQYDTLRRVSVHH
jgi:hypothetical protein